MQQFFRYGLKTASLLLFFLIPTMALTSALAEELEAIPSPCPYTNAADIPEGVGTYVAGHFESLGGEATLKMMACTGQFKSKLFGEAWDELQTYLKGLDKAGRRTLAAKIENDRVKMFLNFLPHDADYILDIFFQHNTGRAEELLLAVEALKAKIFIEENESIKAQFQHELLYFGKCLYASNNPTGRTLSGTLLFGGLHHPLLEQAFLEKAVEAVATQEKEFEDSVKEETFTTILKKNIFTLLRETYSAGYVALSHIITAGDDVTTAQADMYMNLSNFYHPTYAAFINNQLIPEGFTDACKTFIKLIGNLMYFRDGNEAPYPIPHFLVFDEKPEGKKITVVEASRDLMDAQRALGALAITRNDPEFADKAGLIAQADMVGKAAIAAVRAGKQKEAAELFAFLVQLKEELAGL